MMTKRTMSRGSIAVTALLTAFALTDSIARAQESGFALGTGFTYQGKLERHGAPAQGRFDLSFELYDAASGGLTLGRIDRFDVPVERGAFAAELDFGQSISSGEPLWLEIQVRPAGEGDYTALAPRQQMAGAGVGTCTVNSDVLINGSLDLDPPTNATALDIACCNEATLNDGTGQVFVAGGLGGLAIDSSEIQVRALGLASALYLNPHGGNVGIGSTSTPAAPLHMTGLPDVEPGSGGALVIGPTSGLNIGIDGNEIMARNNGATSPLYLNNDGGDVVFGGSADLGYEIVIQAGPCPGQAITAVCPAGKRVVGGGCNSSDSQEEIESSRPSGTTGWYCRFDTCPSGFGNWSAYAICLAVK